MKSISTAFILFILTAGLLVAGCQPKAEPKSQEPKPGTSGNTGAEATNSNETQDPSTIPAEFKHEGFEYYGLGNPNELTYEFISNGAKSTGKQKAVYVGMKDGNPRFRIERSDALVSMGVDDVEVRKDGVYLVGVRESALEQSALALPAKMEVGKSWKLEEKLTGGAGQDVSSKGDQKIVAQESLKTPAGTFDTYVVTLTGEITMNGKKEPVSGKAWYAKEVGAVKLEIKTKNEKGEPADFTITLIGK